MTSIGKWNAPAAGTSLWTGTELNSLASGSMSAVSTVALANQTNLDIYCDLELVLASFSPGANPFVAIYIAEAADGSNYPAPSAADMRLMSSQLLCTIPCGTTAATAQRIIVRRLILPPASCKFYFDNQTGAALASSGNTVKLFPYDVNLNG